ncbi:reverse transcriptase domain-containing protein [Tanacetum coccineum]
MRTRSSSNLVGESSPNPTTSNLKRRNHRCSKQRVEPFSLEESPIVTMADQRTMAELLCAATEGYAEAIVVPPILAEHFELKHSLINMMTSDQFFGLKKDNPHDHIRWFNKITSTIKYKDVPNSTIKLMLFPFSLAGAARCWLKKEPPRSILTWEDLVSKFINEFFPPSRTTNLRNEISNFEQRFGESFHEAWDRYKDLLRACPHHGFTELHQLDTFYNALNPTDQDSLNSATGVKSSDVNSSSPSEIAKLTHVVNQQTSVVTTAMTAILKQFLATPPPASVKAVEAICVTCGGDHPYYQCLAADGNTFLEYRDNIQGYVAAAAAMQAQINNVKNELRNEMQTSIQASMSNQTNKLKNMMASFFQMNTASTSGSRSLPSNTIANPKGKLKAITTRSGLVLNGPSIPMPPPFINPEEDERVEETLTDPDLTEFTIKVPPPLVQKAKPPSQINYVVHQRDPRHPHIPYPLRMHQEKGQEKDEVQIHIFWQMFKQLYINITLADALVLITKYQKMLKSLLSNKEKLIELANTPLNENCLAVILKKLLEKLADFIIVDYESDPRVPLILGRPFLRTARALIDVHGEEMILRDGDERMILNMRNNTSRYSNTPQKESINMIDIYNISHEDYLEDLFANEKITNHPSGNPTSSLTSHTDLTSPEVNDEIFDPKGDIIENLLNFDKTKDLPPYHDNPLSSSTTSSSPSHPISETSDYSLEEFADELAYFTFPLGIDYLPFDVESDL